METGEIVFIGGVLVFVGFFGLAIWLQAKRKKTGADRLPCPRCGSLNTKAIKSKPFMPQDQECLDCETSWKPAHTKSRAIAAIIFGGLFIAGAFGSWADKQKMGSPEQVTGFIVFAVLGQRLITYGVRVLKGKRGTLIILKEGKSQNATAA